MARSPDHGPGRLPRHPRRLLHRPAPPSTTATPPAATARACSGTSPLLPPTTRTRDLALGPCLFHWESRSTTTASSATGQRYVHHLARVSRVTGAGDPGGVAARLLRQPWGWRFESLKQQPQACCRGWIPHRPQPSPVGRQTCIRVSDVLDRNTAGLPPQTQSAQKELCNAATTVPRDVQDDRCRPPELKCLVLDRIRLAQPNAATVPSSGKGPGIGTGEAACTKA